MKLTDLFKRPPPSDESFGGLESSLSEMLLVEMAPPLEPDEEAMMRDRGYDEDDAPDREAGGEDMAEEPAEAPRRDAQPRTTGYTQARLAEFSAFEGMHQSTQADLDAVGQTLARITAAQHQATQFLSSIHSSIHRTNEIELANARLTAENRALYRQAEQVKRLRSQHEGLVEAFKRREAKLVEAADGLRGQLSNTRLDLAEAQSRLDTLEAERQEMMNGLAGATTQAERVGRENEMLREKQINLAADLESLSRRRTEAERKVDELSAIQARDASDLAETRSKLASVEAERQRLQKQHDALQAKLVEASEAAAAMEVEMEEQARRHDIAIQGLRHDKETLLARLEMSAKAEMEAAERIGGLTASLNDAAADRRIVEERLAAMVREKGVDEAGRNEVAALRDEVGRLNALVKQLSPYERLYKAAKEREQASRAAAVAAIAAPQAPQHLNGAPMDVTVRRAS